MSITTSFQHQDVPNPRRGRVIRCTTEGCGGDVVRHSLGCGLAVDRCVRCFTRYAPADRARAERHPSLRRFLHEIVSWREED